MISPWSNPIANFDLQWTTYDIVNSGQCRRGDCSMSSVRDWTTGFAVIGTILLGPIIAFLTVVAAEVDPVTIGDAPVAFFAEEGWLDPVVYAHAMLSAARLRHGAKVICGARVVDLITAGDRVTGVRVADGTQYESDTVVNCAGRWTNEATRDAGLHLPLAPTVGFLVFTPPVAASLSRVVRTTVIDARPDGAGRLMLHWNATDATLSFDTRLSPSMPEARDLVRRARQLLPSIGEVEPEAVRIAIRPIPGDHLSAI